MCSQKEKKSYEEAMGELEAIVERLEKGELTLDESIDLFQKGMELSRYCGKKLDEVERRIRILIEDENGNLNEENFNTSGITEV